MIFYQCSQSSYIISPISLRELTFCSPIKIVIISLTKQIQTRYNQSELFFALSSALLKPQVNGTENGLQNRLEHFQFFFRALFQSLDAFLVFDAEASELQSFRICYLRQLERIVILEIPPKKVLEKFLFSKVASCMAEASILLAYKLYYIYILFHNLIGKVLSDNITNSIHTSSSSTKISMFFLQLTMPTSQSVMHETLR